MPQKPLDASDTTERLTLRLPKRLTDGLDELRGKTSRSEFVRQLIELALAPLQTSGAQERPIYDPEPIPKPKAARPVVLPKIVPAKKHYHRYEKGEEIAGYKLKGRIKVPVYLYTCECGETEVR